VWRDLLLVGESSSNAVVRTLFPPGGADSMGKARPVTAGAQFKTQVNILMDTLSSCAPHYIRCIKVRTLHCENARELPRADAPRASTLRALMLYSSALHCTAFKAERQKTLGTV
jgi:hypothetical protein